MSQKRMLLRILIFIVIVVLLLMYQQQKRNEFISYLQIINECFKDIALLQKTSFEANKAGLSGDHILETEINTKLLRLSKEFLTRFEQIEIPNRTYIKLHSLLREYSTSTQLLLEYRNQVLSQIKAGNLNDNEKKAQIEAFWLMQTENQKLYRKLKDKLHQYAKKHDINLSKYLTNLII